jgi:hypothetical protein
MGSNPLKTFSVEVSAYMRLRFSEAIMFWKKNW